MVFLWESKAKTLCIRDKHALPSTHKMDYLTVYIDFLPALEVLKSEPQDSAGAGYPSLYERYCYIVPKHCVVCDKYGNRDIWRRSCCQTEIDTFVNTTCNEHRKGYQVVKYLMTQIVSSINTYHIKVVALHHCHSCSAGVDEFAECVIKMLQELQHAYKTRELKSFHSQVNLLKQTDSNSTRSMRYSETITALIEVMRSLSKSDTLNSFLKKLPKWYGY